MLSKRWTGVLVRGLSLFGAAVGFGVDECVREGSG